MGLVPASLSATIDCTETALEAQIAALNASCTGDKTIQFDFAGCAGNSCECSGETTIVIRVDANGGDRNNRDITCDGVTIDGEDQIHFTTDLGTCASTDEGGEWLFRVLDATGVTFQDFRHSYFGEGIHAGWRDTRHGDDTLVDNVDCSYPCDDCFTSQDKSDGVIYRNSAIDHCSDKCMTVSGPSEGSYPTYDLQITNNTFTAAAKILSTSGAGARVLFNNNVITDTEGNPYDCDGITIGRSNPSAGVKFYSTGNTMTGCKNGVSVYGGFYHSDGDTWENNRVRGLGCGWGASCIVQNGTFTSNGGTGSGTATIGNSAYFAPGGGVGMGGSNSAYVGLGGGGATTADGQVWLSSGNNSFINNTPQVDNDSVTQILTAENNWWGADADPSGDINGSVDVTPWLSDAPGSQPTIVCGDNSTGGTEVCDGTDVNGYNCTTVPGFTYDGGTLACDSSCGFYDVSGCTISSSCGNGDLNDGEECDGTLIPESCATIQEYFTRGVLTCTVSCTIDSSDCSITRIQGNTTQGTRVSGAKTQ